MGGTISPEYVPCRRSRNIRTKARSDKTECSEGKNLMKVEMQFLAPLLLRGALLFSAMAKK
jgi:hypothetical protein